MAEIRIWGRLELKTPEVIDRTTNPRDAAYLVREYQIAFGRKWVVWAGTRADEPQRRL